MATELDAMPQDFYEAIHEIACNVGTEEYAPVVRDYCERLTARVQELEREKIALIAERDHAGMLQRRVEAELAAMRKRIAESPVEVRNVQIDQGIAQRQFAVVRLPLDDEAKS